MLGRVASVVDVDVPLEIIVDHSPLTLMANYARIGLWNDEHQFLSFRHESRIYLESYKFYYTLGIHSLVGPTLW